MNAHLCRALVMTLLSVALACISSGPAFALKASLQSYAPTRIAHLGEASFVHPQHPGSAMQMAHAGHNDAHGTGTINAVDLQQHKVNLSHNPIPEIGWPAMTMDFPVDASVDLKAIKPGTRVNFTIEQGQDGYEIKAITPVGGGR